MPNSPTGSTVTSLHELYFDDTLLHFPRAGSITIILFQLIFSSSATPYSHHYSTHLTLVSLALSANPVDLPSALHSLDAIQSLADRWMHAEVGLLAQVHRQLTCSCSLAKVVLQVIKLRALVSALRWTEAFPLLDALEPALDLEFPNITKPSKSASQLPLKPTTNVVQPSSQPSNVTLQDSKSVNTPLSDQKSSVTVPSKPPPSELHATLELHVLALGVIAHVQAGRSNEASKRISRLHVVLDSGVLDRPGIRDGVVEVRQIQEMQTTKLILQY